MEQKKAKKIDHEEYKEIYGAALCISSFKHLILSPENAMNLQASLQATIDIPRVPSLNGLIGRCSQPFEKQLTETDVNSKQCRLSINKVDVENAVMPLLKEEENVEKGIRVKVYDANGKEFPMTFKLWAHKLHVLKEGWIEFCTDHALLAHQDFLKLWVIRNLHTQDLCFFITSRRLQEFQLIKKRRLNA
ncbi:hypothetical protein ERO13_A06G065650v2 [Gossypium hirsutum]|uniref:B3 domain-containing protein At4g03170 n=1 Tax=Gossypium hirsutum TaxID=3635 RepID=A0ABM3BW71_GOSHI|nr:putative B3 domain-containing protein At4g03170 [Gossypium hirsutum]KAG4194641.1 hypothetical protein ERO13_A06G065650v2 [Gossypium hirsutum]